MPTTPSKAEQVAESEARARAGNTVPPGETAAALDAPADTPTDPLDGARAPQAAAPAPEPQAPTKPAPQPSIGDQKRIEIMGRFREERPVLGEQDNDEVIAFTKSGGMPAEFRPIEEPAEGEPGAQTEPAAAAPPAEGAEPAQPAPAPEPLRTVKIKVRGEEKEIPLDDVIATARRTYAADDYLDEAKNKLGEVNDLLRQTRDQATRPAPSGQPQAAPNATHPAEPGQPTDPALQPQEDPFQRMVEAIQFGDPTEAKDIARNAIGQMTVAATQEALAAERVRQDGLSARKAKEEFEAKHADIANDPKARAAIEVDIFEQQAEDLKALNVDFNRIRNDGRPATPADIAQFHQILRANGHNVRSPAEMLEKGLERFMEWKGIKQPEPAADPATQTPPAPQPQQQQRSPAPRVTISVDRQQRRQPAASPQPSQPQRPAPAPAPRPQDPIEARASVVQQMQERNARRRGQTLGLTG